MRRFPTACLLALVSSVNLVSAGCGSSDEKPGAATPAASVPAAPASAAPRPQPNFQTLTPEQWIDLSVTYYRERRFLESIGAAQTASYLKPDSAEAYNNVAAAYAELKLWEPAIQAAQQALKINPNMKLARNNLTWAMNEKQRLGTR